MSDSTDVQFTTNVWAEVAVGPLQDCLVTPTIGDGLQFELYGYYRYEATEPAANAVGHVVWNLENFNAVPEINQSCWFKCPFDSGTLVISERPPEE